TKRESRWPPTLQEAPNESSGPFFVYPPSQHILLLLTAPRGAAGRPRRFGGGGVRLAPFSGKMGTFYGEFRSLSFPFGTTSSNLAHAAGGRGYPSLARTLGLAVESRHLIRVSVAVQRCRRLGGSTPTESGAGG
ncbi:hypothetical protein, partial [Alistipes sp. ZOR0009]|uniref:hypothetical protein n=1 Tax=Alistipes sp. ZOR0009 TaxID=1339253 RepID=UPI000647D83D